MRNPIWCCVVSLLWSCVCIGAARGAHLSLIRGNAEAGHGTHEETFTDVPLAMPGTTVLVHGTCQGDLAGSTHYLEIGLGGTTGTWAVVATWFQFDGHTDCVPPYTFDDGETMIPAEQWNGYVTGGAPGEVYLRAEYSPAVEKYCLACPDCNCVGEPECDSPQTQVTIDYDDVECVTDTHCDDGVFCNGAEMCVDYECQPGPGDPCDPLGLLCDEEADQCRSDCNSNGVFDDLDIHGSTSHDCNDNDLPDECDLVAMTSGDCNTNNVPDECDVANLGGGFDDSSFWATFDPGANEVGTDPVGYLGAVFDGRYVYFVPNYNGTARHGEVLRCDTTADFSTTGAWATYNPEANGVGTDPVGFVGGVFDGRFVYFAPWKNTAGAFHGEVLRYDTLQDFSSNGSWAAYDPGENQVGADPDGYHGAVFDGRYVYFVPRENSSGAHGEVLRCDTTADFSTTGAWTAYDPGADDVGNDPDGYAGADFDGRYVYFAPLNNGTEYHGEVLRYDTTADFSTSTSWTTYDPGVNGYDGAAFDGRYVYFAPLYNGTEYHGEVLRYDTTGGFSSASSWGTFDAGANGVGTDPDGYEGAIFIDPYVYFVPYRNGTDWHGEVLRYDTRGDFYATSSWITFDPGAFGVGNNPDGYSGAAFDERYLYFAPFNNGTEYHGEVLRYDTGTLWSSDCNSSGTPDECELADFDTNGTVDLRDFYGFQECFGQTPSQECLAAFDRAVACGTIDLNDFDVFVSHLEGPGGGEMMMGGEGGGEMMMGGEGGDGLTGGPEAPESPEPPEAPVEEDTDPWTCEEADLTVTVQPVGGGEALTTLAPNTTYELHYQAGSDHVNFYVLFAVATSPDQGFAGAAAPAAGDWSATGNFTFVDIEEELGGAVPAYGYPEGYFRYSMAYDDFWPAMDVFAGPQGQLCSFTTGSAGELNLSLYLDLLDEVHYRYVSMQANATVFVQDPTDD